MREDPGITSIDGPLERASPSRFAVLLRHWTWADEAKDRFEQQLADGYDYGEDVVADHPFGAYYHWSALLCGLAEAALQHGLLPRPKLDAVRLDLEASLPGLVACRQLLVVIPPSLEGHPLVITLFRDSATLDRLRR